MGHGTMRKCYRLSTHVEGVTLPASECTGDYMLAERVGQCGSDVHRDMLPQERASYEGK